jgi:hypothetical protein
MRRSWKRRLDRAALSHSSRVRLSTSSAVQQLVDVTETLWAAGDIAVTLANSTIYLEAAGHIVMAWMWLEQLIAASDNQGSFYDGKRSAARYFYTYELSKVGSQLDLLASLDRTTINAQPGWF